VGESEKIMHGRRSLARVTHQKSMAEAIKTTRPDIQGLRALAVLAVVFDHAFAWPSGGFVGVDVFFVISGFLITGLLLRERERSGTISFTGFYRRRVRRILPAAVLVLIATVIGTNFLLGASRLASVVWDAIAALLFSANWRFAATGTDYFQAAGPVSPLQHYWSLSVEEQFYFVWPWVMLLVLSLAGRRVKGLPPRARWAAGAAIGAIGIASFCWALYDTANAPTVAYFSTFSRAWELALGAALAIMSPALERYLPGWLRPLLAWIGIIGILIGLFTTSATSAFPAPAAALPVLATGLVIAAGTGGRQRLIAPLTNRVSRYFGDISYSLYLWHFPVIIAFGPYLLYVLHENTADWLYYAILLAVAVFLSIASYHLVETPIRKSTWLEPRATRGSKRRRRVTTESRGRYVALGSLAAITVIGVVGALAFNALATPSVSAAESGSAVSKTSTTTSSESTSTSSAQAKLTAQITAALAAKSWPDKLSPTVADAADEAVPGNTGQCGSIKFLPAAECTFGKASAPKKALLVGDSIAQAYVPALAKIFGHGDWSLRITSMYACPFIDTKIGNATGTVNACSQRKKDEYTTIASEKPDLLIISNTFERGVDPSTGLAATANVWSAAFKSMIKKVAPDVKKFVVLPPPAPDKNIQTCYTPFSKPSDCESNVANTQWVSMAQDEQATVEAKGGVFIDNRDWYCNTAGLCPAFVGTTLMKKDAAHITAKYSAILTPVMQAAFESKGILPKTTTP
jgi:peptidoglycan/LPS O-acetylase OafA/YrhL